MKNLKLLLLGALVSVASAATAQITYTNWRLNINEGEPHTHFDLRINEWAGMYWTCKNATNFFSIDVSPANPRLHRCSDGQAR